MSTNSTDMLKVSDNPEWETPQHVFDRLDDEFGFTLDVCADETNHKCERYFGRGGIAEDGLAQDWTDNVCWMNPPYGKAIPAWVAKAADSAEDVHTVVVGLVPCRTDTRWWQNHVMRRATEVRFVKGRIQFGASGQSAPFANAIVIWGGRIEPRMTSIDFGRPRA